MDNNCRINMDPTTWVAFDAGLKLRPEFGGEKLMTIKYGSKDGDPEGTYSMEMYMRKSLYDGLQKGNYTVSPDSQQKGKLILLNKAGSVVPRLNAKCY
jgi:hypothetical protein